MNKLEGKTALMIRTNCKFVVWVLEKLYLSTHWPRPPNYARLPSMTNQPAGVQRHQHREGYKVQKLIKRVEAQLSLQAKALRESDRASSKN